MMKYLKYLIGIIALLGLLFIGKGMLTPSVSYNAEITVDKPAKEAWAVMSDESKLPDWLQGIKSVKLISGEKNTVGAVTEYVIEENGTEMKMTETITTIQPNEHIAMTFSMDMMDMDYKVYYDEKNGKTTIRSESITEGNGMLMKSLLSFMGSGMKTQEVENLNKLKKLIEENTTNYFPEPVVEMLEEGNE